MSEAQAFLLVWPVISGCVGMIIASLRASRPVAGFTLGFLLGPIGWIIAVVVRIAPVPARVPPGWRPDPSGRYQHRYWDGRLWTYAVATNGIQGFDPTPL